MEHKWFHNIYLTFLQDWTTQTSHAKKSNSSLPPLFLHYAPKGEGEILAANYSSSTWNLKVRNEEIFLSTSGTSQKHLPQSAFVKDGNKTTKNSQTLMGIPFICPLLPWEFLYTTGIEIKCSASWSWILIKASKEVIQSIISVLLLLLQSDLSHQTKKKFKDLPVIFTSTPAEASNTATAPSRTLKQRSTSTVKSTWPKKYSSFYTVIIQRGNINRSLQFFFFFFK